MKKAYLFLTSVILGLAILTACEPDPVDPPVVDEQTPGDQQTPDDPIPAEGTTFDRIHLIEHFTGEACGYCPEGMNNIYDTYSKNQDKMIWVSNHYGYGTDEYTVTGSSIIGSALAVPGAPNISLNREKYSFEGTSSFTYHPYYTPDALSKTAKTATEQVVIEPTYDAATRLLTVKVKGVTSRPDLAGAMLTVAVTESGMQGAQEDYYYSWEGWTKFVHTHAVRKYLTRNTSKVLGDTCLFVKQRFEATYELTLNNAWVAENCQVAAWITAMGTKYPVLNAAKAVVVSGSQGGEDIMHGGVEAKPIPATYPESGSPVASATLNQAQGTYYAIQGATMFQLSAANLTSKVATVSGTSIYPYVEIVLLTASGQTSIPEGTYEFKSPELADIGDAVMGVRDDEKYEINYSQYYYVYQSSSGLRIYKQWLFQSGTVTVTSTGFTVDATTLNGSQITATYTGSISYKRGSMQAPARMLKKGDLSE